MTATIVAVVVATAATVALEVDVVTAHRLQVNLLPFIAVAAIIAAVIALAVARRFWWLSALASAVLVPMLDLAYQMVRLLLCLFTDCNLE